MKFFIFITSEGYTYQPNSNAIQPDVENFQVLGFGEGRVVSEAFDNFLAENSWLPKTMFNRVTAYELKNREVAGEFYLQCIS